MRERRVGTHDGAAGHAGAFDEVVAALKAGQPAIFATDTVVGIGVAVAYCESPSILFDLKDRSAAKPVAWLVADASALDEYGEHVPPVAYEEAALRWPGAFTAIVKAGGKVPAAYRSSAGSIGLRVPASDVVRALIRAVGCPLATTSANLSGDPAPRRLADVPRALHGAAIALEEAGEGSGVASTVVDFTGDVPRRLR